MKAYFNRKMVACLLVLLLLLSVMPLPVAAENGRQIGFWGDIKYDLNLETGEMVISGNGPIPYTGPYGDDFKKLPWYNCLENIKTVRIEDGVTKVPAMTFPFCNNLTYIYIGADVQTMDANSVHLSDNIECFEVSSQNQYLCSENGILYNKDKTTLLRVPQKMKGHYEIPDTVTKIAGYALQKCELLTSVTIPYGVTTIYQLAFFCCRGLTSLVIPDSVTAIDAHSFAYCENVTELYISEGLKEIGPYAFDGLKSLKHVVLPKNLYKIKACGFRDCTSLESVVIFNKLRDVHLAFDGCENLKDVYYIGTNEELWKFNVRPDHLFYPYNLRLGIDGTLPNGLKWDLDAGQKIMTITGSGSLNGNEDIWAEYGEYFDCVYVSDGISGIEKCIDSGFKSYGTEKVNGKSYKVYSKSYTITFDANGGTNAPAPQTKRPGADFKLTEQKPKRDGYAFLGWAEHRLEDKPTYYSGGDFDKIRDITLYAVWGEVYATDLKLAAPPTKTVYKLGEALSLEGAVVELYCNDGSVYKLPETEFSVYGYDPEAEGKQTVTIDYYGMKVFFEVTVLPADLTVTEVSAKTGRTEYTVGDVFDQNSVELTVTYSDGSTQQVTEGFTVEGFDASKAGVCIVTVSYEGVSTSFEITVLEKETEVSPEVEESIPLGTDASEAPGTQVTTPVTDPGEEGNLTQNNTKTDLSIAYIAAAAVLLAAAAAVVVVILKKKH